MNSYNIIAEVEIPEESLTDAVLYFKEVCNNHGIVLRNIINAKEGELNKLKHIADILPEPSPEIVSEVSEELAEFSKDDIVNFVAKMVYGTDYAEEEEDFEDGEYDN